jgi:uncharacterized protein YoxC
MLDATNNKIEDQKTRRVHFNAFGHAIPDLPSAKKAQSKKMFTVVETREIPLPQAEVAIDIEQTKPRRQLSIWRPWRAFKTPLLSAPKDKPLITDNEEISNEEIVTRDEKSGEKIHLIPAQNHALQEQNEHHHAVKEMAMHMHHALQDIHHKLDEREQKLEQRFHEFANNQQLALKTHKKKRTLLYIAAGFIGLTVIAYLLYIMQNMQNSMYAMSGNMNSMSQNVTQMTANTDTMSNSMETMNSSMHYLNGNVAYMNNSMADMNNNVSQMNHQMNNMSNSIAPIGDTMGNVSPFMKMFKSFSPF